MADATEEQLAALDARVVLLEEARTNVRIANADQDGTHMTHPETGCNVRVHADDVALATRKGYVAL